MPAWQQRGHVAASADGNPPSPPPKPKQPATSTTPAGPPSRTSPASSAAVGPRCTETSKSKPLLPRQHPPGNSSEGVQPRRSASRLVWLSL